MQFNVKKNSSLYSSYRFVYKNLSITPNPAKFGQTVTVTVNVTNIGGKGDLKGKEVTLFYDDKKLTDNLHLSDDESKKIEFKLSENELSKIGSYNIIIGDQTGILDVEEIEETPPPSKAPSNGNDRRSIPGFEAIYSILGISFVIFLIKRSESQ